MTVLQPNIGLKVPVQALVPTVSHTVCEEGMEVLACQEGSLSPDNNVDNMWCSCCKQCSLSKQ